MTSLEGLAGAVKGEVRGDTEDCVSAFSAVARGEILGLVKGAGW